MPQSRAKAERSPDNGESLAPPPLEFFSKKDGGGGENDIIPPMQTAFSVFSRARAAFCGGVWS